LNPDHAIFAERITCICEQTCALHHVMRDHRQVNIKLKIATRPGKTHRGVVSENLTTHHGHRLSLRGIDLARHDARPGLIRRQSELTDSTARPRTEPSDIIRDLKE